MSKIQHVTARNFMTEVVGSAVPVLIDFCADWCGPCRMLSPALERLASEYDGRVKFVKVDVEAEPELASHFRVQSIPMLLAYQDGRPVDRLIGIGSPGQLRQLLNSMAGNTVGMG